MPKSQLEYICKECGHKSRKWLGNCPSCQAWNSFEESIAEPVKTHRSRLSNKTNTETSSSSAQPLSRIQIQNENREPTGIAEMDRALGGGLVKGAFVLVGGDPGIGKSTLLLQMAGNNPKKRWLYVSGEESAAQIKARADRLKLSNSEMLISTETEVERIIELARLHKPDGLICDSIQTLYRQDVQSLPGSVAQIRESAVLLQQYAKTEQVSTLLIGHVTKEGGIAGPRLLEHMVDTVLYFEGDKHYRYRFLRSVKNRFGRTGEVGVFDMQQEGLKEVPNPSAMFLADRNSKISGSAVVPVLEGSRAVLIEIQALVVKANYGQPQRTANGYDHKRLMMMLAVLEKRAGYGFGQHDVFLNVAGGLKPDDRAVDCGVMVALVSALTNQAVSQDVIFNGEVGLGGELRSYEQANLRIKEAERMGFRSAYVPQTISIQGNTSIKVNQIRSIAEMLDRLFD